MIIQWTLKKRGLVRIVLGLGALLLVVAVGVLIAREHKLVREFESRGLERSERGFLEAVKKSDLAAVKLYLQDGFSPNTRYDKGRSLILSIAANYSSLEIVQVLIAAGAKVNEHESGGGQAIHSAAGRGHAKIVRELIKAGADVNAFGSDDEGGSISPLNNAAFDPDVPETPDRIETVKVLLEQGARVNVYHPHTGDGALSSAASSGFVTIIRLLVQHGANIEHEDPYGNTALMAGNRPESVATLLALGANPNHRTVAGTALLLTVKAIWRDSKYLKNKDQYWQSYFNRQQNRIEIVRLLLKAGADPKLTNAEGKTVNYFAEHPEIRKLLGLSGTFAGQPSERPKLPSNKDPFIRPTKSPNAVPHSIRW